MLSYHHTGDQLRGMPLRPLPLLFPFVEMVKRRRAIPEPLSLTVSLRGSHEALENCQVFHLTGLLDAFSEPVFRKVVTKYLEEGSPNIILDLTGIDFVDSSGVGALVQLAKLAQSRSGIFQVVSNARVTQTVKLVRLEKFLSLRSSLQEALDYLAAASTPQDSPPDSNTTSNPESA